MIGVINVFFSYRSSDTLKSIIFNGTEESHLLFLRSADLMSKSADDK